MENSFLFGTSLLIFFLSPLLLFLGLIFPNKFSKLVKKDLSRKVIFKYMTGLFIASFISSIIFVPQPESIIAKNEVKIADTALQDEVKEDDTSIVFDEVKKEIFTVSSVVDGDTIKLSTGETLRFIGIDTPETVHPTKPEQCYGLQASEKTKELLLGKTIEVEKDVSETDRYGRLLRYVYVDDIFVNDFLVREGFAVSSSYPPDVKYQDQFGDAQQEAMDKGRGLWSGYCENWNVTPTPSPISTLIPSPTPQSSVIQVYSPQPTYQPVIQPTKEPVSQTGNYSCNCAKTCSNMASCDEAYFQLNQCGCSKRDGDNDGVPCESICR